MCLLQGERSTWSVRSGGFSDMKCSSNGSHGALCCKPVSRRAAGQCWRFYTRAWSLTHWKHTQRSLAHRDEGMRQVPPLPPQLSLVGTGEAQFLHLGRLAPGRQAITLTPEVSSSLTRAPESALVSEEMGRVCWVPFWRRQRLHWPQCALLYDNQTPLCWEAASEHPSSSAPAATTNLLTFKEQCSPWVYLQGKKKSAVMPWAAGATRAVH